MKGDEFVKEFIKYFVAQDIKCKFVIESNAEVEDCLDVSCGLRLTGGEYPYRVGICINGVWVDLKLTGWSWEDPAIAFAHMGWMKAAMKICISYGWEDYAYNMMDDIIKRTIESNDATSLQNIVNFDLDEFIEYYNSTIYGENHKLLPDHPDVEYYLYETSVEPSWLIYCNIEFDSYLRRCNYHNANECKTILLRWKHDKFPDNKEDGMEL